MRIAFVVTQDRGGPVDLTAALARELADRPGGPEVVIIGPPPVTSAATVDDLVEVVDMPDKTDLRGARSIRAALRAFAPDIVHAQDRRSGLVCTTVARLGVPVALTFHGVNDGAAGRWIQDGPLRGTPAGISGTARLVADAAVCRLTDAVVAPSNAMAGFLRHVLRVPTRKVHAVHNGVAPLPPVTINGPARVFTSVSGFAPIKDVPAVVSAFAEVAKAHPDVRLRLVGDGSDRNHCEARVRSAGIDTQVEFTGYRTDVPAQLRRADVFVLPSLNENLPLALLEAMMAGLACIASSIAGIPEALSDDSGILVPPGDHAALVDAMARLVEEPDLAPALGARAAARAAAEFTIAQCADRHVDLWRSLRRGSRATISGH
jgi:glycosyltransferase involved in cell wall biosynthesis